MTSPALPMGTVTFLFTGIEGSTKLLRQLGETYASVRAEHHRLLRQAFTDHGGVELGTAGDSCSVWVMPAEMANRHHQLLRSLG